MRCKYCGSNALHSDTQRKNFSSGKAVAGAVVFGPVGAAAGLMGKEQSGYRCGACGAFMEVPMDLSTEHSIDCAIADAESGKDIAKFQYYKKQYPNIQAVIPQESAARQEQIAIPSTPAQGKDERNPSLTKHEYRNLKWNKDCPVYVEKVVIHATPSGDTLSLLAWNQGKAIIRSVYFQIVVYDDAGDEIGKSQCVYQGNSVAPGSSLPIEKEFALGTDLAYRVSLRCEKVSLENDTVWRVADAGKEITVPVQPELHEMGFPRLKYVLRDLHTVSKTDEESSLYLPAEGEEFWQCICGQPVELHHPCPRCGATLEKLNELLSQERLQKTQQNCVKKIAADRAAATMKLYRQALQHETDKKYQEALTLQKQDSEESLARAAEIFDGIPGYKDSAQRAAVCRDRLPALQEELREKEAARIREEQERQAAENAKKKRAKKIAICAAGVFALALVILCVSTQIIVPGNQYKSAESLYNDGDKLHAAYAFLQLGDYKNSRERCMEIWGELTHRETISTCRIGMVLDAVTIGVTADETAVMAGSNYSRDISDWSDIISVSAGYPVSLGLKSDGTVMATGNYSSRYMIKQISEWNNIVSVAAGYEYCAALKADGTVCIVGDLSDGGEEEVKDWTDIIAISAGREWLLGLKADGTVVASGEGKRTIGHGIVAPEGGTRPIWNDIRMISAGEEHTVAVKKDGTVIAGGDNYHGQCNVSDWKDIISVAAGEGHTVGLQSDGTVVAAGYNHYGQCNVSDWTDIVAISAGANHTVGLRSDGTVLAVGDNEYGQCDVSDWTDIRLPVQ